MRAMHAILRGGGRSMARCAQQMGLSQCEPGRAAACEGKFSARQLRAVLRVRDAAAWMDMLPYGYGGVACGRGCGTAAGYTCYAWLAVVSDCHCQDAGVMGFDDVGGEALAATICAAGQDGARVHGTWDCSSCLHHELHAVIYLVPSS